MIEKCGVTPAYRKWSRDQLNTAYRNLRDLHSASSRQFLSYLPRNSMLCHLVFARYRAGKPRLCMDNVIFFFRFFLFRSFLAERERSHPKGRSVAEESRSVAQRLDGASAERFSAKEEKRFLDLSGASSRSELLLVSPSLSILIRHFSVIYS